MEAQFSAKQINERRRVRPIAAPRGRRPQSPNFISLPFTFFFLNAVDLRLGLGSIKLYIRARQPEHIDVYRPWGSFFCSDLPGFGLWLSSCIARARLGSCSGTPKLIFQVVTEKLVVGWSQVVNWSMHCLFHCTEYIYTIFMRVYSIWIKKSYVLPELQPDTMSWPSATEKKQ